MEDSVINVIGVSLFKMFRLFFYVLMSVHLAACVYIRVKLEAAEVRTAS